MAEDTAGLFSKPRDWDVLVLDLSLPGGGGVEAVRRLLATDEGARIVIYSMYPEEQYGPRLLRAGVKAYLSKRRSTDELLTAIRRAHKGLRTVTDTISDQLLMSSGSKAAAQLSDRELQIVQLLGEGQPPSGIAATLSISKSTVSTHIRNIKTKLAVTSVPDLVAYAVRSGLTQ